MGRLLYWLFDLDYSFNQLNLLQVLYVFSEFSRHLAKSHRDLILVAHEYNLNVCAPQGALVSGDGKKPFFLPILNPYGILPSGMKHMLNDYSFGNLANLKFSKILFSILFIKNMHTTR